jgi:hypothetical protein
MVCLLIVKVLICLRDSECVQSVLPSVQRCLVACFVRFVVSLRLRHHHGMLADCAVLLAICGKLLGF